MSIVEWIVESIIGGILLLLVIVLIGYIQSRNDKYRNVYGHQPKKDDLGKPPTGGSGIPKKPTLPGPRLVKG